MAPKNRGNKRIGLSLRGKHKGAALEARRSAWQKSRDIQNHSDAFKEPGSSKKS